MSSDVVRVRTFQDNRFYDFDKEQANTVGDLKEKLSSILESPVDSIRILYGGRSLPDEQHLVLIDNVYVCIVPMPCAMSCAHATTTEKRS